MTGLPAAVLFACTMNSVRSPMAEGILKSLHGSRIYVDSVGCDELEVNGFAVQVMAEIDVDLSNHQAKTFANLHDSSFDLVIALSAEARQLAEELTRTMACELEFWPTFDPAAIGGSREARLDGFRQVRDELIGKIRQKFPPDE